MILDQLQSRQVAHKGAYAGGTTYYAGDRVLDQNSTWEALQTTTGNAPPTLPTTSNANWQLVAKQGEQGIQGIQGPAGTSNYTVVRVAATSNVDISTELENGDTLDGVTLATGDLVLLTGQTTPAQNGVYDVAASGAASRNSSFGDYDDLPGVAFSVMEGTAGADQVCVCTSDRGGTIDTTALAFSNLTGANINNAVAKTAPVDADVLALLDSAASYVLKKMTWANLKSAISDLIEVSSINAQTDTAHTLVIGDRGQTITMDNGSANTVTIPPNASVAFDLGTVINIVQIGAGVTTIAGDTGVTLNGVSAGSGDIQNQYQGVSLIKVATNTWVASGDIGTVS